MAKRQGLVGALCGCLLGVGLGCTSLTAYTVRGHGRVGIGLRTDTAVFLETSAEPADKTQVASATGELGTHLDDTKAK